MKKKLLTKTLALTALLTLGATLTSFAGDITTNEIKQNFVDKGYTLELNKNYKATGNEQETMFILKERTNDNYGNRYIFKNITTGNSGTLDAGIIEKTMSISANDKNESKKWRIGSVMIEKIDYTMERKQDSEDHRTVLYGEYDLKETNQSDLLAKNHPLEYLAHTQGLTLTFNGEPIDYKNTSTYLIDGTTPDMFDFKTMDENKATESTDTSESTENETETTETASNVSSSSSVSFRSSGSSGSSGSSVVRRARRSTSNVSNSVASNASSGIVSTYRASEIGPVGMPTHNGKTILTARINGKSTQLFGWYQNEQGEWHYFDKDNDGGMIQNQWKQIDGKWYYFAGHTMARDFITSFADNNKAFYVNESGEWQTGWVYTYGHGYFGAHSNPNYDRNAKTKNWYYFDPATSGLKTVNGWKEISGKWYYFDTLGRMLENTTTPDGYKVGTDGAWIK